MTKRWYKKDIQIMQQRLTGWLLMTRPILAIGQPPPEGFDTTVQERLADPVYRRKIVIAGLRMLRGIAEDRMRRVQESAKHFEDHSDIYGNVTSEMVERFTGQAAEEAKAIKRMDGLIARIEAEGLPEEVMTFNPTAV